MKERAILFGAHGGLIGIVTQPTNELPGTRRGVVLSNVGMHNRIGPFRIWVELARKLADEGFYVLRFDLSGRGDSEPRPGTVSDQELVELDTEEAMSWLADKLRVEEFVLIGLCSGVAAAHALSVKDARVRLAVFIDGYTYRTAGFYVRRHLFRYLQLERWARYFKYWGYRLGRGKSQIENSPLPAPRYYSGVNPSPAQFRADIERMIKRGAHLLFIYTGEVQESFNGASQLFEMLGRGFPRKGITLDHRVDADHLFSSVTQREALINRLCEWMTSANSQEGSVYSGS